MKGRVFRGLLVLLGVALFGGCANTSRVTGAESELLEQGVRLANVHAVLRPVKLNPEGQQLNIDPSSGWISGEVSKAAREIVDILNARAIQATYSERGGNVDWGGADSPQYVLIFSVPKASKRISTNYSRKTRTETLVGYDVVLEVFDPVRKRTVWKGRTSVGVGELDTAGLLAKEFLEMLQRDRLI